MSMQVVWQVQTKLGFAITTTSGGGFTQQHIGVDATVLNLCFQRGGGANSSSSSGAGVYGKLLRSGSCQCYFFFFREKEGGYLHNIHHAPLAAAVVRGEGLTDIAQTTCDFQTCFSHSQTPHFNGQTLCRTFDNFRIV